MSTTNLAPVPVGGCVTDSPAGKIKSWNPTFYVAQRIANLSGLKSITVYMSRSAGATGTITSDIRWDSGGGVPTNYNIGDGGIATNSLDISTLPIYPAPAAAVTFTFPAAVLNPELPYYVAFITTASYTHYIYYVENVTAYPEGLFANWSGNIATRTYNLIGEFDDGQLPTSVTGPLVIPNTAGIITLTQDMTVTSSGDLTLDVAKVEDIAGTGNIHVQAGGKLKLTGGRQITVVTDTNYILKS